MREYSANIPVPVILLGLPLEGSENPFLVLPSSCFVRISVSFHKDIIEEYLIFDNYYNYNTLSKIIMFVESMRKELSLNEIPITRATIDCKSKTPSPAGVYAAVTAAIFYYTAKNYGETLSTYEILEYTSMVDPFEKPLEWSRALDALRYGALSGRAVVFRNEEEYGEIGNGTIETLYKGSLSVKQKLTKDDLGSDVYGAFIHSIGVNTLEGAVRIREASENMKEHQLEPLIRVNRYMSGLFWDITTGDYHIAPGFPGEFEYHLIQKINVG